MRTRSLTIPVVALAALCTGAYATPFMGVTVGAQTYAGNQQLVFSNVANDIQWAVGSYKYTNVNGVWYGPNAPASPGLGYNDIHRKFDAMGLFFRPEIDNATFMIITGMPPTGTTATNVGYGNRQFGPGDLKIDVGPVNYGVGIRQGGLYWGTVDPGPTQPWFRIYKAQGGVDAISARDAGTIGTVTKNPQWDHVDNHVLAPYSPNGYAFFRAGSGTLMPETASVTAANTGVTLAGFSVYAYEVSVPWSALEINPGHYAFTASWRPDCGNDIITARFTGTRNNPPVIPEASSLLLAISGLPAVGLVRRRR